MVFSDINEGIVICCLTKNINGDDTCRAKVKGFGLLNPFFQALRIDIKGIWEDIDKYNGGAHPGHNFSCGGKGKAWNKDSVSWPHIFSHEDKSDGIGSIGAAEGMACITKGGKLILKFLNLRAHDIGTMI